MKILLFSLIATIFPKVRTLMLNWHLMRSMLARRAFYEFHDKKNIKKIRTGRALQLSREKKISLDSVI